MAAVQDTRAALLHLRRLLQANAVENDPELRHEQLAEVLYANQHLFDRLNELRRQLGDSDSDVYGMSIQQRHELHVDGLCAAKVASHEHWILTTVVAIDEPGNRVIVRDDDDDDKRQYILPHQNVIPLPDDGYESVGGLAIGARLLAMYPSTTSFYPATLKAVNPRAKIVGVHFDGDEPLLDGSLPMHYISLIHWILFTNVWRRVPGLPSCSKHKVGQIFMSPARPMAQIAINVTERMVIRGKEWNGGAKRVLALHGWLDNAASFNYLGPQLAKNGYHVVALDLPGHGRSSHMLDGVGYSTTTHVNMVYRVLEQLRWDSFFLVGHSMGANISTVFAGTFPERIQRLAVIEGFGPTSRAASTAAANLRTSVEVLTASPTRSTKQYETLEKAVQARLAAVSRHPGNQYIEYEGALAIVSRGTQLAASHAEAVSCEELQLPVTEGPVRFSHDPLLVLASPQYFTEEQCRSFVEGITKPTMLITARDGWPFDRALMDGRREILDSKRLLTHVHLEEASHHLHIDPSSREQVADNIIRFFDEEH